MNGNAYKKLANNMVLFFISSFGTKIIGFLLVPLYTSYLTTGEYGIADMLNTIVSLVVPVFSVDIADGVIRFILEKKDKDIEVLFVALKVIALGSIALILILWGLGKVGFVTIPEQYYGYIFLSFLCRSLYNTFSNYLKGKEHVNNVVIAGIMSSLINAICNILFLTKFRIGVEGYLVAHLLGVAIPMIYLFICTLNYGYLNFKAFSTDKNLEKEMLRYSAPLILNGVSWWLNNSIDKVIVTFICGASANGLLSVAYKIPSIMSTMQTIFNQAWTLSAIQEFDSKDSKGFVGRIYSLYGCAMTILSSIVLLLNVPLAKLLYANDFFVAWKYTGMLVIAHLFGGLSVCISGVFNAVKDTKTLAITTMIGGIVNVLMNIVLIPYMGVLGATIATMLSNMIVWMCRILKVRSYIKLKFSFRRDIISYLCAIMQCVVGLSNNHMYSIQFLLCGIIIILYRTEIALILKYGINKLKHIKKLS